MTLPYQWMFYSPSKNSHENKRGKRREQTLGKLFSPEVMALAAKIREEIRRREAPEMQALLDGDRLSAEDYQITINARPY